MRIVILGSVALPIPPPGQGGTEWIAYHQAKGLSQKGHKILLVGTKGTKEHFADTLVEVIEVGGGDVVSGSSHERIFDPTVTESSRKLRLETTYLSQVMQILLERKNDYDIILNNMRGEAVFLTLAKMLDKPFVNVMHLNIFAELASVFKDFQTPLITISNAQRTSFPDLHYIQTVHNGVDTEQFAFNPSPKEYLLMVGSIGRHKNQKDAIAVAKETSMKLILAGKIRDTDYFEELKKDIDGKQIIHLGELSFSEKVTLYQEAKAFLFPILWQEPFGLVMIEAMSCGTPVIAYNNGAVPEVVVNGLTGFVVENKEQMMQAVQKIETIDRKACRQRVKDYFTVEKMIAGYESALQKVSL